MAPHQRLSNLVTFVLSAISTCVVVLRFYSRRFLVGKLTSSDWIMLLAIICAWGSAVVSWYLIHFLDYSHAHDIDSFSEVVTGSLLSFWLYRVFYIVGLCLIKTSILLFYCDIAASNQRFQYLVRALLTIVLLGSASMVFAAVFTCYPVADAWSFEVFQGDDTARCYNTEPFWLFNAGYNLVTDTMIWTLPILFLLRLQSMPLRRRLGLFAIFSLGFTAIVASAIRLRTILVWLDDYKNQGVNTANLLLWSQVEQHSGICAASLPFIRPMFRWALTKVRGEGQSNPNPEHFFDRGGRLDDPEMIRTPIIPSPSPTIASDKEFRMPKEDLVPIQPTRSDGACGAAIWDGTQLQQVLPS